MRRVETRIKVITEGDNVKYIPQIKGYNQNKGCNQNIVEWVFYLVPIFGQIFLFHDLYGYIISFFWVEIEESYNCFDPDLSSPTMKNAKRNIDEFWEEYNKPKPIKHKKQVNYIKYP